jgi:hypothetical protein
MYYELWDFDTGNLVGDYPSLSAVLRVLRDAVHRDGERSLEGLALLEIDAKGDETLIAQENELLALTQVRA